MKYSVLVVFVFFIAGAFAQSNQLSDYKVEISYSADPGIFPVSWLTPEVSGKAWPVDTAEMKRSERIILKALNKYPLELILKNLTKVYVVKRLEFYGQVYGGTNSIDEIYISNDGILNGYSDSWIEQAFHSELSSIIFRNYQFLFSEKKWKSLNDNVRYGSSGKDAVKESKASKVFDAALNKKGILSQYGESSIEEDFNIFAENLFISSPGFWTIVKEHKRIRKKTDMVIRMYGRIDDVFTENYFREISRN